MKKILIVLLAALLLVLSACGESKPSDKPDETTSGNPESTINDENTEHTDSSDRPNDG